MNLPTAIVEVGTTSSRCSNCGLGVWLKSNLTHHDEVVGYYAVDAIKPDPCGAQFVGIQAAYMGPYVDLAMTRIALEVGLPIIGES